jgi:glycopeptide antibiotics resistance protein
VKRPTIVILVASLYLVVLARFLTTDYERALVHQRLYLLEVRYASVAGLVKDVLLNVGAFVPAGWLLDRAIRDITVSRRARVWIVGGFCALFSLGMETLQFFMRSRHSSAVDVLTDTAGAVLGAWLASRWE